MWESQKNQKINQRKKLQEVAEGEEVWASPMTTKKANYLTSRDPSVPIEDRLSAEGLKSRGKIQSRKRLQQNEIEARQTPQINYRSESEDRHATPVYDRLYSLSKQGSPARQDFSEMSSRYESSVNLPPKPKKKTKKSKKRRKKTEQNENIQIYSAQLTPKKVYYEPLTSKVSRVTKELQKKGYSPAHNFQNVADAQQSAP